MKLLKQVCFLCRQAQAKTAHKKAADVDRTLNGNLQQTLTRALHFNSLVVFKRYRDDLLQFSLVAVQGVESSQDPLTISTGGLVQVGVIDVPEILKGLGRAVGYLVKQVFISDEQHPAILEDSPADIDREFLEDRDVEVEPRDVLQSLLRQTEAISLGSGSKDETDIDIRPRAGFPTSLAAEKEHSEHVRILPSALHQSLKLMCRSLFHD